MSATNSAQNPVVSFVVPCYKLAHFLRECVESILSQTYKDFEILIMDDCSPDETPAVAQSFRDCRVKYIRNESNLGHLRNYNKGIELARGCYVWLISADDRLRCPDAVGRYVDLLEEHPSVGYAFCPAVALHGDREGGLLPYSARGSQDRIFRGRAFLAEILRHGGIVAPSVFARKECYSNVSMFALDMPHQGDMYLWCLWALHYDVGYIAEPMVAYRLHAQSMMNTLTRENPTIIIDDEFTVRWRLCKILRDAGEESLLKILRQWITGRSVDYIVRGLYGDGEVVSSLTLEQCEDSLRQHAIDSDELTVLRARLHAKLGDEHYWHKNFPAALKAYRLALRQQPAMLTIWIKYLLLRMGTIGIRLRSSLLSLRERSGLVVDR